MSHTPPPTFVERAFVGSRLLSNSESHPLGWVGSFGPNPTLMPKKMFFFPGGCNSLGPQAGQGSLRLTCRPRPQTLAGLKFVLTIGHWTLLLKHTPKKGSNANASVEGGPAITTGQFGQHNGDRRDGNFRGLKQGGRGSGATIARRGGWQLRRMQPRGRIIHPKKIHGELLAPFIDQCHLCAGIKHRRDVAQIKLWPTIPLAGSCHPEHQEVQARKVATSRGTK